MTTVRDPTTVQEQAPPSIGRRCEGCPRCTEPDAGFCKTDHQRWGGLHPVCKRCGHCVLRGKHDDDISDLEVKL